MKLLHLRVNRFMICKEYKTKAVEIKLNAFEVVMLSYALKDALEFGRPNDTASQLYNKLEALLTGNGD